MFNSANISKQIRVVLTAISLLLVIALNNREITTYVAIPAATNGHQVTQAPKKATIVKQKVFFEATASYIVLQLAAFPEVLRVSLVKPVLLNIPLYRLPTLVFRSSQLFFCTAIQPNAP